MNGEDVGVAIFLGLVLYVIVTLFICATCFGEDSADGPFLEENKKNYIVIVLWPITMVLLLPVIIIGAFKVAWWLVCAAGIYVIGIKDLYKKLVAR